MLGLPVGRRTNCSWAPTGERYVTVGMNGQMDPSYWYDDAQNRVPGSYNNACDLLLRRIREYARQSCGGVLYWKQPPEVEPCGDGCWQGRAQMLVSEAEAEEAKTAWERLSAILPSGREVGKSGGTSLLFYEGGKCLCAVIFAEKGDEGDLVSRLSKSVEGSIQWEREHAQ